MVVVVVVLVAVLLFVAVVVAGFLLLVVGYADVLIVGRGVREFLLEQQTHDLLFNMTK